MSEGRAPVCIRLIHHLSFWFGKWSRLLEVNVHVAFGWPESRINSQYWWNTGGGKERPLWLIGKDKQASKQASKKMDNLSLLTTKLASSRHLSSARRYSFLTADWLTNWLTDWRTGREYLSEAILKQYKQMSTTLFTSDKKILSRGGSALGCLTSNEHYDRFQRFTQLKQLIKWITTKR